MAQGQTLGSQAWQMSSLRVRALVRRDRRRESPGSRIRSTPAFGSAVADRDLHEGLFPGDSGGTAPDSHRLPLLSP
ncbi:hypothetical protein GCM10010518_48350 [Kitasatospora cinereorecta]